jgi:hypothetical protein
VAQDAWSREGDVGVSDEATSLGDGAAVAELVPSDE